MGQEDLKKKFERIHLKTETSEQLIKVSAVEKQKIRFKNSTSSDVHQQIKNAPTSSHLEWKNLLTSQYERPHLSNDVRPIQNQIQWNLYRLLGRPVLVSFFVKNDEMSVLEKMNKHIQERSDFWFDLLQETNHLHVRTNKGKLNIWLKSDESTEKKSKFIQSTVEREYLSHPQQLKSFQVKNSQGWTDVTLEVDLRNLEARYKGSDL